MGNARQLAASDNDVAAVAFFLAFRWSTGKPVFKKPSIVILACRPDKYAVHSGDKSLLLTATKLPPPQRKFGNFFFFFSKMKFRYLLHSGCLYSSDPAPMVGIEFSKKKKNFP